MPMRRSSAIVRPTSTPAKTASTSAKIGWGEAPKLLSELISGAQSAGFRQMIAVIGGAEPASIALHSACGFRETGRMRSVGFKFGRWLDSVYMQLSLVDEGEAE